MSRLFCILFGKILNIGVIGKPADQKRRWSWDGFGGNTDLIISRWKWREEYSKGLLSRQQSHRAHLTPVKHMRGSASRSAQNLFWEKGSKNSKKLLIMVKNFFQSALKDALCFFDLSEWNPDSIVSY